MRMMGIMGINHTSHSSHNSHSSLAVSPTPRTPAKNAHAAAVQLAIFLCTLSVIPCQCAVPGMRGGEQVNFLTAIFHQGDARGRVSDALARFFVMDQMQHLRLVDAVPVMADGHFALIEPAFNAQAARAEHDVNPGRFFEFTMPALIVAPVIRLQIGMAAFTDGRTGHFQFIIELALNISPGQIAIDRRTVDVDHRWLPGTLTRFGHISPPTPRHGMKVGFAAIVISTVFRRNAEIRRQLCAICFQRCGSAKAKRMF